MRPDERDATLVADMIAFCEEAIRFSTGVTFDDYLRDELVRRSIERVVSLIGEAANQLSREFRDTHPEVPWRLVIAMRHVLVHGYSDLEDARVWGAAVDHVPELLTALKSLNL
jgi:uncharacterized protein with HEPN domain